MKIKLNKSPYIEILKGLTIGVFVVISTFPENDWTFSPGVDSPLSWVFNYLYEYNLNLGKHIIFPHGPLALFMYPLAENIFIATLLTALLKLSLTINLLKIVDNAGSARWFITFIFAYFISVVAGFNQLLLTNILLLYLNFYNSEKRIYKLSAFFLTAFAFYVKSYVAIMSGIIGFSFLAYYLFSDKNYKKFLIDIISILAFILLFWLWLYRTFDGFITYLTGMFHLAEDNSAAASYYPYNNWAILFLFIATIFIIPFVNKTKKSFFYSSLIFLSLFAAWKHGMAREDIYHVRGFLIYVLIALFVFVIFHYQKSFLNIILSIFAVLLLTINMKNAVNYTSPKYELFGINNFIDFLTDFSKIKTRSQNASIQNISGKKLPGKILDAIRSETVDVYPWDYTIIPANNLKWQPRVVIQSYAAYTSWLDNRNATHFNSKNGPSILIWDLEKGSQDLNGGYFSSIDDRYLLNDEPQTMIQILGNYKPFFQDNKFMIFKKRALPVLPVSTLISDHKTSWGAWVPVPENTGGLLRLKLNFKKSVIQQLKSFFYKDEQIWIYLKFSNEIIHKYRIIPKNAQDGIWVSPYIFNTTNKYTDIPVANIMFKCSNKEIMHDSLEIEWEKISFGDEPNYVLNFFNKSEKIHDSIFINSINTFEASELKNWNKLSANQIIKDFRFAGSNSNIVAANSYSAGFSFSLDSLSFNNLKITADCWVKANSYNYSNDISLILSIDDTIKNITWKGMAIDGQLIDRNQWNNIYSYIDFNHVKSGCLLKAYLWNTSNNELYLDDFKVTISKQ